MAVKDNTIVSADIATRAREIDFVTSFAEDIKAMQDIFSISSLIKKSNGSTLKIKRAWGELQSGEVAEGDEIPFSHYNVEEQIFGEIKLGKYRKGVSIEAIAEKGYDNAVAETDSEFKTDLRNLVIDKFYTELKSGTLTFTETTFQMAVAMAIGHVKDKFSKMRRTATGVAVWVNTVDLYKYLGSASISTQNAFGMTYVNDFLGADVMIISSEIEPNTVIATPLNNIAGYYVDPADSEFRRAGLEYITDSVIGLIGYHAEGNYGRALSESFAILGVTLMAEYIDAIAVATIGNAQADPELGDLTVTSTLGSEDGYTVIAIAEDKQDELNVYKYKITDTAATIALDQNVKGWAAWDGVSEIEAADGKVINIVECNKSYRAVASGYATVVSAAVVEPGGKEPGED